MGKQRWEESEKRRKRRREKIREEKESEERRWKGARKGKKVAKHCVFPMGCSSGGWKSRLAKAASAEPCGQMRDEKLQAVVVRSTLQVKKLKTPHVRSAFGSWDVEKVRVVVAWSTFPSHNVKNTPHGPLFEGSDVVLRGRRTGPCTLPKVSKTRGFCSIPKTMAGVGHSKRIWKDAFRLAGGLQETCSSEMLGGQGANFLRGVEFWSVWSSGLLRWFCVTGASTSYDLSSLLRGRRGTLHRWTGKIAKRIGTRPSAPHSTFHVWRKSRRIASFLMLPTSKIDDISKNCFVFDVIKVKDWGSLAE